LKIKKAITKININDNIKRVFFPNAILDGQGIFPKNVKSFDDFFI